MRRAFRTRRVVAAVAVATIGLTGLAASASADAVPCHGDVVVKIEGVRLLNEDGSRTAGPYSVALDAGRYRVDAASHDGYHGQPDQITQPNEEWQVITDSGWASGYTIDIPDLEFDSYTIFPDNAIPASTSIIVSHRGIGNINSVDPVCVSFTRLPEPTDAADDPEDGEPGPDDPQSTDPESGGPEAPQTPEGSTPTDPAEPPGAVPDDGDPDTDDPDGTKPEDGDPAAPSEPGDGEPEGQTPGDPGPESGGSDDPEGADDPESTDDPEGTSEPEGSSDPEAAPPGTDDTSEPIEPEVQGKVEEPGPTPALARTGLDDLTVRLLGLALVMLGLGGLATRRSGVLPNA